jgi:Nose resistant-to-fluoxetine protein, N-terminal domain
MLKNWPIIVLALCALRVEFVFSFVDDISQLRKVKLNAENESDRRCESHFQDFVAALARREDWALESIDSLSYCSRKVLKKFFSVFDAWAKVPSGMLQGNSKHFGFFTACIKLTHDTNNLQRGIIEGQHCMVSYRARESTRAPQEPASELFSWVDV